MSQVDDNCTVLGETSEQAEAIKGPEPRATHAIGMRITSEHRCSIHPIRYHVEIATCQQWLVTVGATALGVQVVEGFRREVRIHCFHRQGAIHRTG